MGHTEIRPHNIKNHLIQSYSHLSCISFLSRLSLRHLNWQPHSLVITSHIIPIIFFQIPYFIGKIDPHIIHIDSDSPRSCSSQLTLDLYVIRVQDRLVYLLQKIVREHTYRAVRLDIDLTKDAVSLNLNLFFIKRVNEASLYVVPLDVLSDIVVVFFSLFLDVLLSISHVVDHPVQLCFLPILIQLLPIHLYVLSCLVLQRRSLSHAEVNHSPSYLNCFLIIGRQGELVSDEHHSAKL